MEKWSLRELLIALIVGIVTIAIASAIISIFYPYNYGYGHGGMMWGFGMGFGWIFMLIPIILIILIILALLPERGYYQQMPQQNSLEILNQRYARGEISREEYLRIKDDLERR